MSDETNNSIGEIKCIILKDKREIHLNDQNDDISISIISDGITQSSFPILYPEAGYSSGSLFLSPSQMYLIFAYYSGQSEEAFTLFKIIGNRLELVFESGYSEGEAASYGFSRDENLLIQGLPISCSLYDWKDYVEQGFAEKDETENMFFEFGYINILDIAKKILSEHQIRVYPSENAENFPEENYNPFMCPTMISADAFKISMPWGAETLELPLKETIIFHIS